MIRLSGQKFKKGFVVTGVLDPTALANQLAKQRRTVDFDTFDIQMQQLVGMLEDSQIWIAPAYQRQFRWDPIRCSELVESLMLGIPIPNLFMATNSDNTWEVVDGLQRLSTIAKFAGSDALRAKLNLGDALVLQDLKKLDQFTGFTYETLPPSLQQHWRTRPIKVVTLNDKSDDVLRFDLFERLNTGGIALTKQEIRDCVWRGGFADLLDELSETKQFTTVVKLPSNQKKDGTAEECVLRFFAFLDRWKQFEGDVTGFLNQYQKDASQSSPAELSKLKGTFLSVFDELSKAFPKGITRTPTRSITPLNLFEGVAVGAALALKKEGSINTDGLATWMSSEELRKFSTVGTNHKRNVRGRIEFCRDRFLGKPYVPDPEN
ncbi:MAG TPA: DUF262 domain-containing protein [Rhizomicrobium sp.]|nr:DUF262 domain-containing protein [Rhizomicrobium sp.]